MALNNYLTCPHRNVQSFTEYCLDCGWNIWTTEKEYYAELKRRNPPKEKDYPDEFTSDF